MYISILIGVGYSCFFTSFDAYIMIGFCFLDGFFTIYRIFLGFGTVPFLTFVLGGKACDVYLNYEKYILYILSGKVVFSVCFLIYRMSISRIMQCFNFNWNCIV